MVSRIINKNANKLDLPSGMRNHKVFHISFLDQYAPAVVWQPSSEPPLMTLDESREQEWEGKRILDTKLHYHKLHYLGQRAGYNHVHTSCEPAEYLENAQKLVDDLHWTHPEKPWLNSIEF
jgi:hypothetical protein